MQGLTSLPVQTIIKRYRRALDNLAEARSAFERLHETAPPAYVDVWEASIQEAESARFLKPSAMDVMQSKIKTGQTLKEITADIWREETEAKRVVPDTGSSTDWLLEGLKIEDEQWVFYALQLPAFDPLAEFVSDSMFGVQEDIQHPTKLKPLKENDTV
jgi:hypothetical protein